MACHCAFLLKPELLMCKSSLASRRGPFLPAQLRAVRVNALYEPKVFESLNHRTDVIRTDVRHYRRTAFFQLRYEGGGDALISAVLETPIWTSESVLLTISASAYPTILSPTSIATHESPVATNSLMIPRFGGGQRAELQVLPPRKR